MLAVVKKPHTKVAAFKVIGNIDRETLDYLNNRFGQENVNLDDEIIDINESEWFKSMDKKKAPGDTVRIYRENMGLTQQQLAEKAGLRKASYISDIERGRRLVSKNLVKKFSELFGVSPELFL